MKRLIFGLLVAGVAFGGSAFTNAKHFHSVKGNKTISSDYLAKNSSGSYFQAEEGGTCTPGTLTCHYTVNSTNGIPDRGPSGTYSTTEINSYVLSGWLTTPTESGVYNPPL